MQQSDHGEPGPNTAISKFCNSGSGNIEEEGVENCKSQNANKSAMKQTYRNGRIEKTRTKAVSMHMLMCREKTIPGLTLD